MVTCASSVVEFPKKGFVDIVHIIDQDDMPKGYIWPVPTKWFATPILHAKVNFKIYDIFSTYT